ncbi:thiamine pyrophosphate-binding protein [Streptomyces vinaceus]|uniref:thiamine pyrophosphate-binding protein n=1 Tax=Streptomyces vinaceus TaxID=1960 RepID=UPI0037F1A037
MTRSLPGSSGTGPVRLVDQLVTELARAGVRHVFGVGGANIEDLFDAVHRSGTVRAVVAKHEFSAVTMADGCARSSRRLGVVAATSGGGAMNMLPGLAEAHASRVPVLALVGQPPTDEEGRGAFQDSSGKGGSFDLRQVLAPVSRFCARVEDVGSFAELLSRAMASAQAPPRGPSVLLLPKDVQRATVRQPPGTAASLEPSTGIGSNGGAMAARFGLEAGVDATRVAGVLSRAGQILVIAGEEVAASGAREELALLAGSLGAWVAVTPDAKDVFDNRDPCFAGVAGVMGHANVEACLRRADVCLLAGTRLPLVARAGLEHALAATEVVYLGSESAFVPATTIRGDLRDILRTLDSGLMPQVRSCPPHAGPRPAPPAGQATPDAGKAVFSYARALAVVEEVLPEDAHVFVDAGNTGSSAVHHLPAPRDGRFVVAVGMGGMGYTFGAGIGAALTTGRRTYVLAGDGSFFMHGMEVHTAVEYSAPVTFVVFNNNAHAMCVLREQLFQGGVRRDDSFRRTDIAGAVAAAFPTLDVTAARSPGQLRQALRHANAGNGPAFIALDCDANEIPPFLPFQHAIETDALAGHPQRGERV